MCVGVIFLIIFPTWDSLTFLNLYIYVFHQIWIPFSHYFFKYFFAPLSLSSPSEILITLWYCFIGTCDCLFLKFVRLFISMDIFLSSWVLSHFISLWSTSDNYFRFFFCSRISIWFFLKNTLNDWFPFFAEISYSFIHWEIWA